MSQHLWYLEIVDEMCIIVYHVFSFLLHASFHAFHTRQNIKCCTIQLSVAFAYFGRSPAQRFQYIPGLMGCDSCCNTLLCTAVHRVKPTNELRYMPQWFISNRELRKRSNWWILSWTVGWATFHIQFMFDESTWFFVVQDLQKGLAFVCFEDLRARFVEAVPVIAKLSRILWS